MANMSTKLALCTAGELYGGVERFINDFAVYLTDNDSVDVITVVFYDGELAHRLRKEGVEVAALLPRWKYDPGIISRLVKLLRARDVSLVHTHGYLATVLAGIAAKKCGVKVVKTEHGRREPRLRRDFKWLRMHGNLLVDRLATRLLVDHIVYVSNDLRMHFQDGNRNGRCSVIYNGVFPVDLGGGNNSVDLDRDAFNMGIVGRISAVKGHIYAIRAFASLRPNRRVNLYILGEGGLEQDLRIYCRDHGLADRVHFMGFRTDVLDWIAGLDVLLMPSIHEGLPYTLLEAMWLGTPVIASRVGGLAEILEDAVDALLVEPGDDQQLAVAIERAMAEPNLGFSLATSARAKVERSFTIDRMVHDYLCLYEQVCEKPKGTFTGLS